VAAAIWDDWSETMRCLTPADIAYFLFEAGPGERACVMNENCAAYRMLYHPMHDPQPIGPPVPPAFERGTPRRAGVILKVRFSRTPAFSVHFRRSS
jgi:hypothetical protein